MVGLGLMEIFSFARRIRFQHPDEDPDRITSALGILPARKWKRGDPVRGQKGPVSRVYDHSYWSSEPIKGEDSELLDRLDADLTFLETKALFLRRFRETGGRITYYVSWFASERSGGDTIGFNLLGRLAALRIDLALDVYSWKQDSDEEESALRNPLELSPAPDR